MYMNFICETCGEEYSRETYTARDSKHTKEYWRSKEGERHGQCTECWLAAKAEKRRLENEASAREAEEAQLPVLIGSEKQVAWANTIRKKLIDRYTSICVRMDEVLAGYKDGQYEYFTGDGEKPVDVYANYEEVQADYDIKHGNMMAVLAYLRAVTDAKTYIDNRDRDDFYWIGKVEKEKHARL